MMPPQTSRRTFLRATLALPATAMLAACMPPPAAQPAEVAPAPAAPTSTTVASEAPSVGATDIAATGTATGTNAVTQLEPTPTCGDDDDEPTLAQTEGPYYTPNTPQRTSFLEPGITGTPLLVSGFVLSTSCQPVTQALVDFWHCDADGVYDNMGYRLRGHQFSDEQGRYVLETILPGVYPGRTRHIHVKVQAPNQPVLTTQLYFPDEPENSRDGIFDASLVMEIANAPANGGEGKTGQFNFVLSV